MKSDKPFRWGLICGTVLFVSAIFLLRCEPSVRYQESYIEYGHIFVFAFLPSMLASVWIFFSKQRWTLIRFFVVTILSCLCSFVLLSFFSESLVKYGVPIPKIAFSTQPPSSWVLEKGQPITDIQKNAIGDQVTLKNRDGKRIIWVAEWNTRESFEQVAQQHKQLLETRVKDSGFELKDNTSTSKQKAGSKTALIYLRGQKGGVTRYISSRIWTQQLKQEQIFLDYVAMGQNVEITNDQEIADIIATIIAR